MPERPDPAEHGGGGQVHGALGIGSTAIRCGCLGFGYVIGRTRRWKDGWGMLGDAQYVGARCGSKMRRRWMVNSRALQDGVALDTRSAGSLSARGYQSAHPASHRLVRFPYNTRALRTGYSPQELAPIHPFAKSPVPVSYGRFFLSSLPVDRVVWPGRIG